MTVLPEKVQVALSLRGASNTVPADVEKTLRGIPFFSAAVPVSTGGGRRFGGFADTSSSSSSGGGGRRDDRRFASDSAGYSGGRSSGGRGPSTSDDGFETYHNNRRRTGGGGGAWRPRPVAPPTTAAPAPAPSKSSAPIYSKGKSAFAELAEVEETSTAPPAPPTPSVVVAPVGGAGETPRHVTEKPILARQLTPIEGASATEAAAPAPAPARWSSAALRASTAVEDRMMMRVKGKVNRLGNTTYDATKVFMQQILSSDDTDFLDELMRFLFSKASLETRYCPLYARLVHELADEFPHFRVVLRRIFTDYITTFAEVDAGVEPDPGSDDYEAFKVAQERKRGRRGYSQFVAELVKLGEVDVADYAALLAQVLSVVEAKSTDATCQLMCEEYIDCFASMCHSASGIMGARANASWAGALRVRIDAVAAKPVASLAGFTSKARFAMMGLSDYAKAGWRNL